MSVRDDLCDALKKHYMRLADREMAFFPQMLEAIEAYRQQPRLKAQLDGLKPKTDDTGVFDEPFLYEAVR